MLSYKTLDFIADAYTPLLALGCIGFLLWLLTKRQWSLFATGVLKIVTGGVIAYGLMFIDHRLKLWPVLGLDYSTHTAVALVLVMFLCAHLRKTRWLWVMSLVCYALLMLYQRYHTFSDIVTTAVVVGMLYLPVIFPLTQKQGALKS